MIQTRSSQLMLQTQERNTEPLQALSSKLEREAVGTGLASVQMREVKRG